MAPLELFRHAVAELGDVSAAELSTYIEKKHGVTIEPHFIPLFRATLQDLERTARMRRVAQPCSSAQR